MDDDRNWERWGALGGILFVVLVAITAILPGYPPKTGDSASKIADFIGDNGNKIRWAATTGGLAVVALFWWLGSVWRLMRRGEGGSPRLTVTATAGAVFAAVMATIGAINLAVIPVIGTHTFPASQIRYFYILSANIAVATMSARWSSSVRSPSSSSDATCCRRSWVGSASSSHCSASSALRWCPRHAMRSSTSRSPDSSRSSHGS